MASLEDIKRLIDSSNEKVISHINQEVANLHDALTKKIDNLSSKLQGDIIEVKAETEVLRNGINMLEGFLRLDRRNLLIARNIPVQPNENVYNLFEKIANIIG